MGKFLSWMAKRMANALMTAFLAALIIMWWVVFALSWPSATPTGETSGGKFAQYFSNMFNTGCSSGSAVKWFTSSGVLLCETVSTGTGTYGWYTFYIDGYPSKKMFGMGTAKGGKFYGLTYCDPKTVDPSCGYSNEIDCSMGWGYTSQEACTNFYGATYRSGGYYRYKVSVNGLKVNTVTQEY